MPLNIEPGTANGDFTPYAKYNSKAGRWYTKTDDGVEVEVANLVAIADLENISIGWVFFAEGEAPDAVWARNGTVPPRPSKDHKRGFRVLLFSQKNLFGVREFTSTAGGTIAAMKALYDGQFENAPERKRGLVPLIKCVRVTPEKTKHGTNFVPVFQIIKWTSRPAELQNQNLAVTPQRSRRDELDDDIPGFEDPVKPTVNPSDDEY